MQQLSTVVVTIIKEVIKIAKTCTFTLDEETVRMLDELTAHGSMGMKTNKSEIIRELIRKQYILTKGR